MKKLLIVEDDKEINKLLCSYLGDMGYAVQSAFNGLEAVSAVKAGGDIALVILDLMLPFRSGDGVLKGIREFSSVPVMIVSAKDTVQAKIDLLRMGADDYITKPFDLDEVLVRVEALLRRCGSEVAPEHDSGTLSCRELALDRGAASATLCGQPLTLTSKEYAILELLLLNPTKLFSKANLFESVWGEAYSSDDNTLKVHMSNLRGKLKKAAPDDEYIETVWGMGYKLKS